jgi:hypothetical protein
MQLKNKKPLGSTIASAACGLLGSLPTQHVRAAETPTDTDKWTVDSALLYYGESDSRVQDASLKSAIKYALDEDRALNINFSVDALTGASPSGAVPTDSVQTFTRPSGNASYQIAAGETPLDDTFRDTRVALAVNWQQPIGELSRVNFGVSASNEYDYLHIGADARFERDFNQRNTTLFVGAAYGNESIEPEGGTPAPFAPMQAVGNNAGKLGTDKKTVIDGLVGVTQILSRRSLLTATYSYSVQDGYLNDAFKVVSVVDSVTGRPVAGPSPGLGLHRYESRPDSRAKHSVFAEWRYALDRDSLAIGYRFMTDDWGVDSNTLEARYRWNFSPHSYLEPQLRFYQQSAADFYRSYLVNGQPLPQFASADYRLAEMTAITAGAKYGFRTKSGEWSLRLEYYKQDSKSDDPKIGVLANYDLVPSLTAVIAQIGYKFKF